MPGRSEDHIAALRTRLVQTFIRERGASEDEAFAMASTVLRVLNQAFAGERLYFPRPRYDAQAVLADFNGRNRDEVCRKHRISRTTFYELIDRNRK